MRGRRFKRRIVFDLPRLKRTHIAVLIVIAVLLSLIPTSIYLRNISTEKAIARAVNSVTNSVNTLIADKMSSGDYGYNYFVSLEKDGSGNITALTTNVNDVNTLSAEIMKSLSSTSTNGEMDIDVPLGSLMDSPFTSGRGPDIPVRIIMLTSSTAKFRNDFTSGGINQTKHQIVLELAVDLSIVVPWDKITETVTVEVLVAETVIVGRVPGNMISLS